MEKQKLIKLLRDAYLTGVKEKTFADQMKWLDYDYEAMGGAYAGAVVNNGVLDDVINCKNLDEDLEIALNDFAKKTIKTKPSKKF